MSAYDLQLVRDLHKALTVVVSCCLAMALIFVMAYVYEESRLTSQEILRAVRIAVNSAVDESVRLGGLDDGESYVRNAIETVVFSQHYIETQARILRYNDFDPYAVFFFDVNMDNVSARFHLEGVKDPLLAIRLGLDWTWREDPYRPYKLHRSSTVMSDCLTNHYFHMADDGPDFFARLENRTEDAYHYGVETFIVINGKLAIDHLLLSGKAPMDEMRAERYGLD